jgi:hypothetical protein
LPTLALSIREVGSSFHHSPRFRRPPYDPGRWAFPSPVLTVPSRRSPSHTTRSVSADSHTLHTGMLTLPTRPCVSQKGGILSANSNQWYFNNLVKKPCHKTHCRCLHRLNLSFQSSRSCALPNIKLLKDKDLEFANSIRGFFETASVSHNTTRSDCIEGFGVLTADRVRLCYHCLQYHWA